MTELERLLADLDAVLRGGHAPFRAGLASRGDGVRIDELLDARHVARIMAWYDHRLGAKTDRRPALSIWMGWHFQSVLPPLVAANVLLDRSPTLDLDAMTFALSPEHKAVGLGVGPDVHALSPQAGVERFEPLVRTYLGPLVAHAAGRTALTPRVLWSNAGHVFERIVAELEASFGPRPGLAAARALLAMPVWPDGVPNMLHAPVRTVDGRRLRRVCCMRYLFPDGRICGVCPMQLARPPRQKVHA